MRRRAASLTPLLVSTLTALVLLARPERARAQDADWSGTYTVATDSTSVQIPEWGPDCGPRPASHQGSTGRQVSLAYNGSQIVVTDGRRTWRTDSCWSDNPRVRRISASHNGARWTVICQTPQNEYQQETGNYTITAEGSRVTMREETTYSWTLRGSNCRASATRTLAYNRVGGPPVVATADAGSPAPVRDASAPPPNRCASPGAPARLEIVPGRRALAPGGRACFRARVLDSNNCDAAGAPAASWQIARANGEPADLPIDASGCVRAPAGAAVAEYNVTATAGTFTARAVAAIVSAEELRSLIAQHIEDDPNALPALSTGTASGTGVGAVVVRPPTPPPAPAGPGLVFWLLVGTAGLLGVVGIALLMRRRSGDNPAKRTTGDDEFHGPGTDPSSVSGRRRYETVPIPVRHRPAASPANNEGAAAGAEPPNARSGGAVSPAGAPEQPSQQPRPLTRRCPTCNERFTSEMAFCPEHGTPLVDVDGTTGTPVAPASGPPQAIAPVAPPPSTGASAAEQQAQPALPLRCPKCGRRYEKGFVFCGEDGSTLVADG